MNAQPDADLVFRRMGEEMVLVHLPSDRIYVLNTTGARIWELLLETADLETVKARLLEEFEGSPEAIEAELATFVTELERLRLQGHGED